jgi:hypothetical protein
MTAPLQSPSVRNCLVHAEPGEGTRKVPFFDQDKRTSEACADSSSSSIIRPLVDPAGEAAGAPADARLLHEHSVCERLRDARRDARGGSDRRSTGSPSGRVAAAAYNPILLVVAVSLLYALRSSYQRATLLQVERNSMRGKKSWLAVS